MIGVVATIKHLIANDNEFNLYLIFCAVDILQINSNGVLSGIFDRDITYSMRGQIRIPVLIVGNLEFPKLQKEYQHRFAHDRCSRRLPLIQAHCILHKQ